MFKVYFNGNAYYLPFMKISADSQIAIFDCLSDASMTADATEDLIALTKNYQNDFDVVMTAETKGVPFAMALAQRFNKILVVLRKTHKLYHPEVFKVNSRTYTTAIQSSLYGDVGLKEKVKGKKVLIVDDVISTGSSIVAMEDMVKKYEAEVFMKCAVLAEGDAKLRKDILFVDSIPLFDLNGNPK